MFHAAKPDIDVLEEETLLVQEYTAQNKRTINHLKSSENVSFYFLKDCVSSMVELRLLGSWVLSLNVELWF